MPGVGRVDVQASDIREIEVIADPAKLSAQQMTFTDLATAIQTATTVDAVGRMPEDYRQYLIVTTNEAHSADDIANIVVGHGLRVGDLASVRSGTEDHVRIVAGDGKPAALLNITQADRRQHDEHRRQYRHDRGDGAQDAAAGRGAQARV